jgi:hypothetical protein
VIEAMTKRNSARWEGEYPSRPARIPGKADAPRIIAPNSTTVAHMSFIAHPL